MTQADFANRAGINVNTLRNYERGDSIPNLEVAASICRHFKIKTDWLILGEGPMRPGDSTPDAPPAVSTSATPPAPVEDEFKMTEMVTMTVEILESDTIYRTALASNIRAFHQAVRSERTLAHLEERMAQLESKVEILQRENMELKRCVMPGKQDKAVGEEG
jgi:DNA-binding XRE family transcriptional regulator